MTAVINSYEHDNQNDNIVVLMDTRGCLVIAEVIGMLFNRT